MSSTECHIELVDLVDMYIYLQLHNPLVIDEAEPKQYPKEAVEYYAKNYNSHEDLLHKISSIFEKGNSSFLDSDITYTPDYSRTEFYSGCFQVLTESYSVDEIVKIVKELKFNYLKVNDNYNFIEFAINKLSSKALSKDEITITYSKKRI